MTEPAFTDDWFSGSAVNGAGAWATHVLPRLRDRPSVLWLEIGSYEGRSALWTAANLLIGAKSQLVCVDIWPDKYLNRAGERVEEVFDRNTRGDKRIVKLRGKSNQVLPLLRDRSFQARMSMARTGKPTSSRMRARWRDCSYLAALSSSMTTARLAKRSPKTGE